MRLAVVVPLVAGCSAVTEQETPAPTTTVTVTAVPDAASEPTGPPPADVDDPLLGVRTVQDAWVELNGLCRGGLSGHGTDAACDARDEISLALERATMAAYVRAWHLGDVATLSALTAPDDQDTVDHVLSHTLPEGESPACELLEQEGDPSGGWQCMISPVEGAGSEGSPGWAFVLDPSWAGENAPDVYVLANQLDFG